VCELNREVEDTDRRVVHRTIGLKKKRRCLKKVLAWHHHRREVDDGNQFWQVLSPAGTREPPFLYQKRHELVKSIN